MTNLKKIAIAFCILTLSLMLAGCSHGDRSSNPQRKISKISRTIVTHTLVEDVASGQVIADDTKTEPFSEDTFIWDGDVLLKYSKAQSGQLLCSYVYTYTDGRLTEIKDEVDGQLNFFSYSDGHLDNIAITTDSNAMENQKLFYDELGRVKSIRYTQSDGAVFMFDKLAKCIIEIEYSENNISKLTIQYHDSIESDEPYYSVKYNNITYSTAINPLKGLFTCNFVLAPWEYFSENYVEGTEAMYEGEPYEQYTDVTLDGEYPIKFSSTNIESHIKDGIRTTVEESIIADFEYLD